MTEEAAARPAVRVIVVRDVPHVVVDVELAELRRRDRAETLVHVPEMVFGRLHAVESPHDHRRLADVALGDPADVVLVVPGRDLRGPAQVAAFDVGELGHSPALRSIAYTGTPMCTIQFDHVAIAVEKISEALAFLVGVLGGSPSYGADAEVFRFGHWRFDGGGRLEILEPRGSDGFLHRFLQQRGPGVHHVTFKVPSLREACDRAEAHGFSVVGHDESDPEWKEAFLHPRHALGIVVQFAEASGSGEPPAWEFPPSPPDPPPPMRLVGLRVRARAVERATLLWGTVLGGVARAQAGGDVVFEWPGSPMRITMEIDANGDEGPVSLELAGQRRVEIPEGPHPVFGVVFTQGYERRSS